MPCCLLAVAAMFPRIALIVMWLGEYSDGVFRTTLWPVLGFLFMPFTTCAYVFGMVENGSISGWALVLLIIGVMFDLGSHGGGANYQRTRMVRVIP